MPWPGAESLNLSRPGAQTCDAAHPSTTHRYVDNSLLKSAESKGSSWKCAFCRGAAPAGGCGFDFAVASDLSSRYWVAGFGMAPRMIATTLVPLVGCTICTFFSNPLRRPHSTGQGTSMHPRNPARTAHTDGHASWRQAQTANRCHGRPKVQTKEWSNVSQQLCTFNLLQKARCPAA